MKKINNEYNEVKITLSDLVQAYNDATDIIDVLSDDDANDDAIKSLEIAFETIGDDLNDKLDNMAYVLEKLQSDINLRKEKIKKLQKKNKSTEKVIKNIKNYIQIEIEKLENQKVKTLENTFYIANNPTGIKIDDVEKVPSEFKEIITDIKVDKRALIKALKDNEIENIDGIELTQTKSLRIR